MNASLTLDAEQATALLRLALVENAQLRRRIDDRDDVPGSPIDDDSRCVVCAVRLAPGVHCRIVHAECSPTIMSPTLRADIGQLLAALRARGDLGRPLRMRVDRVATAMGAA